MAQSKIEWTEYSWNFATGCNKVSPGCKNCYAGTIAKRFWKNRKFTDVRVDRDKINLPYHLRKPRMIFVNSMSDLFHDKITTNEIIDAFDVMANCDQHTYQILTKRPQRMYDILSEYMNWLPEAKHIWLGVSVENQKTANERIPILLKTPAAVRWISAEPLLDEIKLRHLLTGRVVRQRNDEFFIHNLNWVVVGGESGKNKRPFDLQWARSLRDECKEAPIPFFMKQVDKIQPIPEDLFIREYPFQH